MGVQVKFKADGSIERYKASLVVRGDTQTVGIDYNDTFSLVVKITTVKYLIAVAVKNQCPLFQFDVNNAFLHGDLDEEVYMKFPQDDIILTGDDVSEISALKSYLDDQFRMKDLGQLNYFLGIEVISTHSSLLLNQRKFIMDLLSEHNCTDVSPLVSPIELNLKLKVDDRLLLSNLEKYRSLVGKFNFLTHTRPHLSFLVQHLRQLLQAPRVPHLAATLHLLRYLKGTVDYGILINNSSDFTLQGPISWKLKKQPVVSLSSAEVEYRSLNKLVAELTWLTRLLDDLGVERVANVSIFYDNHSALHFARNPVFHERTKHIEVDCHFLRGKLSESLIDLHPFSSSNQLADILTKPLTGIAHHGFLSKLKVLPPSN
uniref:Uncharacterized mitochondrial protein AtMg00810-like n=1 Tax=Nicotiana tabacum TaxID=4097 RepID=A0A1S3ZAJ3_TOBAC|nr:PREDICTED: uncharacterized mitochondrial protein AtMg00810-like [Nicotiana tabacum]